MDDQSVPMDQTQPPAPAGDDAGLPAPPPPPPPPPQSGGDLPPPPDAVVEAAEGADVPQPDIDQTLSQLEEVVGEVSEEAPAAPAEGMPAETHDEPEPAPEQSPPEDISSPPPPLPEPPSIDQVRPPDPNSDAEATLPPMPFKDTDDTVDPAVTPADPLPVDENVNDDQVAEPPKDEPSKADSSDDDSTKAAPTEEQAELDNIKNVALKELAPIADKLDQPPEERFATLLQLVQATDKTDLVKPTLDAAKSIENESAKAQALLDVVNEVNYLENKDKS